MLVRLRVKNELLVIAVWTALTVVAVLMQAWPWLRIVLGAPVVLFFPGYCVMAVAAPRKDELNALQRVAMSFAVSIIAFPLVGVVLNYAPFGINVVSVVLLLSGIELLFCGWAWLRRRSLAPQDRMAVTLPVPLPWSRRMGPADLLLNAALTAAAILAIASVVVAFAAPRNGERFTELYILGAQGSVLGYPRYAVVDTTVPVTVGIVNDEGSRQGYRVEVQMDGNKVAEDWNVEVENGGEAKQLVTFTPRRTGDNRRVDFLLFRETDAEPYRFVSFWIAVKAKGEEFTEFYLRRTLDVTDMYVGNALKLETSVVNHSDRSVKYRLVIRLIEWRTTIEGPAFELGPEERWDKDVPLLLDRAQNVLVHYQLYQDGEPQPRQVISTFLEIRSQK